jgi:hypothetical protein
VKYLHAHPTDHGHEAADRLGKLLAQGLLGYAEIMEALVPHSPGEQTRLAWTLLDSARMWEMRRGKTEREIAYRIRPLIDALADADPIFAVAHGVNESFGHALLKYEVHNAIEMAMRYKLAALDRDRKRARGR